MNTKALFTAALISFSALSGAAFAADTQSGADMSRDQVIAEMKEAQARGLDYRDHALKPYFFHSGQLYPKK